MVKRLQASARNQRNLGHSFEAKTFGFDHDLGLDAQSPRPCYMGL